MKTADFYTDDWRSDNATHTYYGAIADIDDERNLRTTQMCLLNEVKDYDVIRIHRTYDLVEIVNNHDGTYSCDRTDKEIRRAHNLFKMWESGVFDL